MITIWLLPLALIAAMAVKRSVIKGVIIFNVFLFIITEFLSLLKMVTPVSVVIEWIVFILAALAYVIKKGTIKQIKKPDIFNLDILITGILSTALIFPALFTVPYNYDSMCYHLPRIMFWIQNRSVSYYVANDLRQLVTSPFTEYIQMHTMLLSGDDMFFNMVSYVAGLISIYLICSIVFRISGSKPAAAFSGLLYVTTPVIESEMISTQVDVVAGMWVIICVSLIYDLAEDRELKCDKNGIIKILYLGFSMGLLFITKTNACIPVAVMLLWLLYKRIVNKDGMKTIIKYILISGMAAVIFAFPSFIRNYGLCGDILASDYMGNIAVGSFLPSFLIVNALKNMVMIGVLSSVPDSPLRSFQLMIVKGAGKVLGVNINDPKISFVTGETAFQDNTGLSYEHDHAGAQFLLILFIIFVVIFIIISIRRRSIDSFMLFLVIQASVMFMAVRWQPWVGRLLIPSIVLMIIFAGCIMKYIYDERKKAYILVFLISLMVSCFVYCRSYSYNVKPALLNLSGNYSRNQLYFYNNGFEEDKADKYERVCKKARECKDVEKNGIGLMSVGYTYPQLRILMADGVRVENINLDNPVEDFYPECITAFGQDMKQNGSLVYNENEYACEYALEDGRYSLLIKK